MHITQLPPTDFQSFEFEFNIKVVIKAATNDWYVATTSWAVAAIFRKEKGAYLALEASRSARNRRASLPNESLE